MLRAAVGMFKGRVRICHARALDCRARTCCVTERRVPLPDVLLLHVVTAQRCTRWAPLNAIERTGEQGY